MDEGASVRIARLYVRREREREIGQTKHVCRHRPAKVLYAVGRLDRLLVGAWKKKERGRMTVFAGPLWYFLLKMFLLHLYYLAYRSACRYRVCISEEG